MNKENYLKGRWNRLKEYLNLGIILLIATFFFLFTKERLASALAMENFPVTQLSILLLLETSVLIFFWIHAAYGELQMFQDYFEEFVPPVPRSSFSITVFIAIFLGILGFFSYRIVIYSSIFVCFKLVEILGGWLRGSKLRAVLKRAREEAPPDDNRRKGWDVIESFEFEIPHVLLGVTVLFFSFVSLILGLLGELLSQSLAIWLLSAAYIIMLLSIAFAEVVLMKWRHKRDAALGDSYF